MINDKIFNEDKEIIRLSQVKYIALNVFKLLLHSQSEWTAKDHLMCCANKKNK